MEGNLPRRLACGMQPVPVAGGVAAAADTGGGRSPGAPPALPDASARPGVSVAGRGTAVRPGFAPSSRTSLAQNAASASGGAVLTSLFVTPLEVLKVRVAG